MGCLPDGNSFLAQVERVDEPFRVMGWMGAKKTKRQFQRQLNYGAWNPRPDPTKPNPFPPKLRAGVEEGKSSSKLPLGSQTRGHRGEAFYADCITVMSDSDELYYDALDIDDVVARSPFHQAAKRRRSSLHPLSGLASPIMDPTLSPDVSSLFTTDTEAAHSNASLAPSILVNTADEAIRVSVKAHDKRCQFGDLFLIQELSDHAPPRHVVGEKKECMEALPECPIGMGTPSAPPEEQDNPPYYVLKFSKDGHYLAAGGQDRIIRVWKLIVQSVLEDGPDHGRSPKIFHDSPSRRLYGHEGEVLDLAWGKSASNYLLSASMDRTVRMWHPGREECLAVFKHVDFVTSIAVHPKDDRLFLSGSLDGRLRLWSIESRKVLSWHELGQDGLITAVAFNPSGKVAICGTSTAQCLFFDCTRGLQYHSQITVCSRRGKNRKGSKLSGLDVITSALGDDKLLVSSNDSRMRVYRMKDKGLECKYAGGFLNASSQIKGVFSKEDGCFVLTASEDGFLTIFCGNNSGEQHGRRGFLGMFRRVGAGNERITEYERFQAFSAPCTTAIFAPTSLRNLLISAKLRPTDVSLSRHRWHGDEGGGGGLCEWTNHRGGRHARPDQGVGEQFQAGAVVRGKESECGGFGVLLKEWGINACV